MRTETNKEETLLDKEREYYQRVFKNKWRAEAVKPQEFERRYTLSLRNGGKNLRFRAYKAYFDFLLRSEGRFLDCACGAGHLSIWLAQNDKRVWAFDFSENAIDVATESAQNSGVGEKITFSVMDARNLGYEDEYFDVVTGMDCILHLIKYPDAIKGIARVLKQGGKAVFVEPLALNPLINIMRFATIHYFKRVGEHMLTRKDLRFLEHEFGSICLDHFYILSTFNKLIACKRDYVMGMRKRLCMMLDSFDVFILRIFPFLSRYASICYVELTKTKS